MVWALVSRWSFVSLQSFKFYFRNLLHFHLFYWKKTAIFKRSLCVPASFLARLHLVFGAFYRLEIHHKGLFVIQRYIRLVFNSILGILALQNNIFIVTLLNSLVTIYWILFMIIWLFLKIFLLNQAMNMRKFLVRICHLSGALPTMLGLDAFDIQRFDWLKLLLLRLPALTLLIS